jgi:uncharacterized membrane protein
MRLKESVIVAAPCEFTWEYLADLDNHLHFLAGVTRWEAEGQLRGGMGARRRMLMRVGSAEIGGLIEFVEWHPPRDMAWTSVSGIDQRGRYRVRGIDSQITRVEFRYAYGVAGAGVFGWISERIAAPTLRRNIKLSLQQLKRQVELERLRSDAAERAASHA